MFSDVLQVKVVLTLCSFPQVVSLPSGHDNAIVPCLSGCVADHLEELATRVVWPVPEKGNSHVVRSSHSFVKGLQGLLIVAG